MSKGFLGNLNREAGLRQGTLCCVHNLIKTQGSPPCPSPYPGYHLALNPGN